MSWITVGLTSITWSYLANLIFHLRQNREPEVDELITRAIDRTCVEVAEVCAFPRGDLETLIDDDQAVERQRTTDTRPSPTCRRW